MIRQGHSATMLTATFVPIGRRRESVGDAVVQVAISALESHTNSILVTEAAAEWAAAWVGIEAPSRVRAAELVQARVVLGAVENARACAGSLRCSTAVTLLRLCAAVANSVPAEFFRDSAVARCVSNLALDCADCFATLPDVQSAAFSLLAHATLVRACGDATVAPRAGARARAALKAHRDDPMVSVACVAVATVLVGGRAAAMQLESLRDALQNTARLCDASPQLLARVAECDGASVAVIALEATARGSGEVEMDARWAALRILRRVSDAAPLSTASRAVATHRAADTLVAIVTVSAAAAVRAATIGRIDEVRLHIAVMMGVAHIASSESTACSSRPSALAAAEGAFPLALLHTRLSVVRSICGLAREFDCVAQMVATAPGLTMLLTSLIAAASVNREPQILLGCTTLLTIILESSAAGGAATRGSSSSSSAQLSSGGGATTIEGRCALIRELAPIIVAAASGAQSQFIEMADVQMSSLKLASLLIERDGLCASQWCDARSALVRHAAAAQHHHRESIRIAFESARLAIGAVREPRARAYADEVTVRGTNSSSADEVIRNLAMQVIVRGVSDVSDELRQSTLSTQRFQRSYSSHVIARTVCSICEWVAELLAAEIPLHRIARVEASSARMLLITMELQLQWASPEAAVGFGTVAAVAKAHALLLGISDFRRESACQQLERPLLLALRYCEQLVAAYGADCPSAMPTALALLQEVAVAHAESSAILVSAARTLRMLSAAFVSNAERPMGSVEISMRWSLVLLACDFSLQLRRLSVDDGIALQLLHDVLVVGRRDFLLCKAGKHVLIIVATVLEVALALGAEIAAEGRALDSSSRSRAASSNRKRQVLYIALDLISLAVGLPGMYLYICSCGGIAAPGFHVRDQHGIIRSSAAMDLFAGKSDVLWAKGDGVMFQARSEETLQWEWKRAVILRLPMRSDGAGPSSERTCELRYHDEESGRPHRCAALVRNIRPAAGIIEAIEPLLDLVNLQKEQDPPVSSSVPLSLNASSHIDLPLACALARVGMRGLTAAHTDAAEAMSAQYAYRRRAALKMLTLALDAMGRDRVADELVSEQQFAAASAKEGRVDFTDAVEVAIDAALLTRGHPTAFCAALRVLAHAAHQSKEHAAKIFDTSRFLATLTSTLSMLLAADDVSNLSSFADSDSRTGSVTSPAPAVSRQLHRFAIAQLFHLASTEGAPGGHITHSLFLAKWGELERAEEEAIRLTLAAVGSREPLRDMAEACRSAPSGRGLTRGDVDRSIATVCSRRSAVDVAIFGGEVALAFVRSSSGRGGVGVGGGGGEMRGAASAAALTLALRALSRAPVLPPAAIALPIAAATPAASLELETALNVSAAALALLAQKFTSATRNSHLNRASIAVAALCVDAVAHAASVLQRQSRRSVLLPTQSHVSVIASALAIGVRVFTTDKENDVVVAVPALGRERRVLSVEVPALAAEALTAEHEGAALISAALVALQRTLTATDLTSASSKVKAVEDEDAKVLEKALRGIAAIATPFSGVSSDIRVLDVFSTTLKAALRIAHRLSLMIEEATTVTSSTTRRSSTASVVVSDGGARESERGRERVAGGAVNADDDGDGVEDGLLGWSSATTSTRDLFTQLLLAALETATAIARSTPHAARELCELSDASGGGVLQALHSCAEMALNNTAVQCAHMALLGAVASVAPSATRRMALSAARAHPSDALVLTSAFQAMSAAAAPIRSVDLARQIFFACTTSALTHSGSIAMLAAAMGALKFVCVAAYECERGEEPSTVGMRIKACRACLVASEAAAVVRSALLERRKGQDARRDFFLAHTTAADEPNGAHIARPLRILGRALTKDASLDGALAQLGAFVKGEATPASPLRGEVRSALSTWAGTYASPDGGTRRARRHSGSALEREIAASTSFAATTVYTLAKMESDANWIVATSLRPIAALMSAATSLTASRMSVEELEDQTRVRLTVALLLGGERCNGYALLAEVALRDAMAREPFIVALVLQILTGAVRAGQSTDIPLLSIARAARERHAKDDAVVRSADALWSAATSST